MMQGYIPPADRTRRETRLTAEFDRATPGFHQVGGDVPLPEAALLYDLEIKATGSVLPRIWQQIGSCVGAAAARAYEQTQAGDFVHRNTQEDIRSIFPWATWGVGRRIAGMNTRGGGSFGAAQAKAVADWGMLPIDHPLLPKPTNRNGWLLWTSKIETDYSVPRSWPVREAELAPDAEKQQMTYVARIRDMPTLLQAFAQGYGVTVASMFGTSPTVREGFLVGDWNRSWAHQMSLSGYLRHPSLGLLIAVDNQWGPDAHGTCPYLESRYGRRVRGSFWITEATAKRIMQSNDSEVFAHGNSEDFPPRVIDWGSLGMGE
jgi:hypothetical protein